MPKVAVGLVCALAIALPSGSAWSQSAQPKRVVELRIRLTSGPELRLVEPDGGLAVLAPKDAPVLGLTPVILDLEKQLVRLTVFDLRPNGAPGKRAIEDIELSKNVGSSTTRTSPTLGITVTKIRDVAGR
jgi:hypothetical protein